MEWSNKKGESVNFVITLVTLRKIAKRIGYSTELKLKKNAGYAK